MSTKLSQRSNTVPISFPNTPSLYEKQGVGSRLFCKKERFEMRPLGPRANNTEEVRAGETEDQ